MNIDSQIFELAVLLHRGWTPYDAVRSCWSINCATEAQQQSHDATWCRAAFLAGLIFAHKDAAYRRARA
jgi:hypothetical protein